MFQYVANKFSCKKYLCLGLTSNSNNNSSESKPPIVMETNFYFFMFIYRFIQFLIVLSAIIWFMCFEKCYQAKSSLVGGAAVKIKGIGFTNYSKTSQNIPDYLLGPRIWYPSDYVIPTLQTSSFFLMTNAILVENQTQQTCPESENVPGSICFSDAHCKKGVILVFGNGILTGRCILSSTSSKRVCEIFGWCPVRNKEIDFKNNNPPLFPQLLNVTVLIKNSIEFPKYGIIRNNMLPWKRKGKLFSKCRFNPNHSLYKYCPIFRIGDILRFALNNNSHTNSMLHHEPDVNGHLFKRGGFFAIHIDWQCDLDRDIEFCLPKYEFSQLNQSIYGEPKEGFHFHYANNYRESNQLRRQDMRLYGIQFFIIITGEARKFEIGTLFINLGSALAILAFINVICDIILFYCIQDNKTGIKDHQHETMNVLVTNDDHDEDDDDDDDNNWYEMNFSSKLSYFFNKTKFVSVKDIIIDFLIFKHTNKKPSE